MSKKRAKYVNPYSSINNNNLPDDNEPSVLNLYKHKKSNQEYLPSDEGTSKSYNYESTPYDPENLYSDQLPILEDIRSNNQSTLNSLGNSFGKFIGKTGLNVVGGLAGSIYGIGAAIGEGKVSKIWDNSFMDAVDSIDKGIGDYYKVYKSSDYEDQNILQRAFLHPTQFIDDTSDALSFTAGAIITELLTAGVATETIIPKALKYMKYLGKGAEAAEATSELTSIGQKLIRGAGKVAETTRQLATGAGFESMVEARQATLDLRSKMMSDWHNEHPGESMSENVKSDIDDRLSKAGLFTYLTNLALVGSTNIAQFPKIFGVGAKTAKIAEGSIIRNAETGLFESVIDKPSLLSKVGTALKNPFEEGIKEEGLQNVIQGTAKQYWDRKNDEGAKKDTNTFLGAFAQNLANTYTSKEGWNDIGMGMIIGSLGAPGRGALSVFGKNNAIGKYGFEEVHDDKGNVIDYKRREFWDGGVVGSLKEKGDEIEQVANIVDKLNSTNGYKAMKANYDFLVQSKSLQNDQDKALSTNDLFEFNNTKDDQIHAYVSSRIKAGLYDDVESTIDDMKKLSPDDFYIQFKGEEEANKATDREKSKFKLDSIQEFTKKAENTKEAYDIADNVYQGDNEDLKEQLVHSIAASKNIDLRENAINKSLADLSNGRVSNMLLKGSNTIGIKSEIQHLEKLIDSETDEVKKKELQDQLIQFKTVSNTELTVDEYNMLEGLKQSDPTSYTLNKDKITTLLQDSRKLRQKRQDYLDIYNALFTEKGQKDFEDLQSELIKQKEASDKLFKKQEAIKIREQERKDNIKAAKEKVENDKVNTIELDPDLGTKEAPQEDIFNGIDINQQNKEVTSNEAISSTEDDINELSLVTDKPSTEDRIVASIEEHKETQQVKELSILSDGLVKNHPNTDISTEVKNSLTIINSDYKRTEGTTISYLSIDKVQLGKIDGDIGEIKTFNEYDDNGNLQINKNVDVRLFSQNEFKVNDEVSLIVPSFEQMKERGLQNYNQTDYTIASDNIEEFPIGITDKDGKIIGYLPTQSGIERLVAEEFKKSALEANLAIREQIYSDKDNTFKVKITTKSPGWIMTNLKNNQKSLYNALGDGSKLADKVYLSVGKSLTKDTTPDLYIDNSKDGIFTEGEVINMNNIKSGVVYSILPSSAIDKYIAYPMDVKQIGKDKADLIVEAIRLFAKKDNLTEEERQSLNNIREYNFNNFDDVSKFINEILYTATGKEEGVSDKNIFKLYKDNLILSATDSNLKFKLTDIINSSEVRDQISNILSTRFHSIKLENLNSKKPYISYSLEDSNIKENTNNSYQDYLNSNQILTSNVNGIKIQDNEYAFTSQPVIALSDPVIETKEVTNNIIKSEEPIQDKPKLTKKTLGIDPNKLKGKKLDYDINPEYLQKANITSGEDLMRKCRD